MSKNRKKDYTVSVTLPETLHDAFVSDLLALPLEGFKGDYLKANLLTKFVGTETDSAQIRSDRAIEKWLNRERENAIVNHRLFASPTTFAFRDKTGREVRVSSDQVIAKAASFIADALGPVPRDLFGGFSGGATTSKNRRSSSTDEKFATQGDVTADCEALWAWMLFQHPMLARTPSGEVCITPNRVQGNILFCVPKTSTIDRVACKEPDLNMYVQKAIGNHYRRSLRSKGIDLNDQTRNQELARVGSIDGSLATIDLSSASDSMTLQLCCRLFDPDWYDLMMRARSPFTQVDGVWHELEMMSSMGNGFTFEAESLVFWALARACAWLSATPGVISVYGDDIIVPTDCADLLIEVLSYCGFTTNKDKTFTSGPFRESCGSHWHNGRCVKPFFIRRPISTLPDLILHLNAVRQWCSDGVLADPRFLAFWLKYSAYVPKKLWGAYEGGASALNSAPVPSGLYSVTAVKRRNRRNELGSYVRWWHMTEVERLTDPGAFSRNTEIGFRLSRDPDSARKFAPRVVFFDAESGSFV